MIFSSNPGKSHAVNDITEKLVRRSDGVLERHVSVDGDEFKLPLRYCRLKPLGKGSYGSVCSAYDLVRGIDVAIKKIHPLMENEMDTKRVLREIRIMRNVGLHENITTLFDVMCSEEDDTIYIVMELMDADLHAVTYSVDLTEKHILLIMSKLLRAVAFMHSAGIIHRDLKPANILLSRKCDLRVCDFGLARAYRASGPEDEMLDMTRHVVTRRYRSPELMLTSDRKYDESIDMWSVGCIFAELLGKKPLFPGKTFKHQLTLIMNIIGAPTNEEVAYIRGFEARKFLKKMEGKKAKSLGNMFPNASLQAIDLLKKLLMFDPMKRLSADEALHHPYFDLLEKESTEALTSTCKIDWDFEFKKTSKFELMRLIVLEASSFKQDEEQNLQNGRLIYPLTSEPHVARFSETDLETYNSAEYYERCKEEQIRGGTGILVKSKSTSKLWSSKAHKRNRVLLLNFDALDIDTAGKFSSKSISQLPKSNHKYNDSLSSENIHVEGIFETKSTEADSKNFGRFLLKFNIQPKMPKKKMENITKNGKKFTKNNQKTTLMKSSQEFFHKVIHLNR